VVIIVYDITVRETFLRARELLCYLPASLNSFSIVLVGNKTDRSEGRQISTDEGSTLAQEHKARFLETSADARAKDIRVVFTSQLEDNIKSRLIPNSLGRHCPQHRTSQLTLLAKPARHEPTALGNQELAQIDGFEYKGIDDWRKEISTETKVRHQGLHKERILVQKTPRSYWSHEDESEIRDDKQGIQVTWWRRIMTCW
jgi:GTPase SAR1 family protein